MKPRLIVQQQATEFVSRYGIHAASNEGQGGGMVAFAARRRLAPHETVEFFTDESRAVPLFCLRAETAMGERGRYFVQDINGNMIGMLRKASSLPLNNITWHILDVRDKSIMTLSADRQRAAALHRLAKPHAATPKMVSRFLEYHLLFRDNDGHEIGGYSQVPQNNNLFQIKLTEETLHTVDWRVLAALTIAIDT